MKNKVAIFGSGLSALYAYAACVDNGVEAEFFSDKPFEAKPEFFGPVKLSWIPPRIKATLYPVWLFSLGNKADYLTRMGRNSGHTTFPENGREETLAYNPSEVSDLMQPVNAKIVLGRFTDGEIEKLSHEYLHTFVTFPLQQSKSEDRLVSYWIYLLKNQNSLSLPNMVIYNGVKDFSWTRFSHYWNSYMWEFSHLEFPNLPPRPSIWAEPKQIFDIAPNVPEYRSPFSNVTLLGRWARWSKSVLAQDAYSQVDKILKELFK
ncbi:MAG TPA: hypothetical protein PK410_00030 [Paludibacteraceae bacterium]|jgi:hypothetical protein|nr:hypothetical protein [Paludibacteraceae bacterium]